MADPQPTLSSVPPDDTESPWTDACIRWTEDDLEPHMRPSWSNKNFTNQLIEDNENDETVFMDPFADPDPTQDFTLEYPITDDHDATTTDREPSLVQITVRGYKADADETWESTGLTLWKATNSLNDYILQHYYNWKGYAILELGAGLGVCGILASKLLARLRSSSSPDSSVVATADNTTHICLTDGDTQALAVMRGNVKRNDCETPSSCSFPGSSNTISTTVRQLLWGHENAKRFANASTTANEPSSYQIILASDIIYAPQVLVPLWETIQVLLAPEGTFVLAFAKRKVPVQVQDVLQTAKEYGFECTPKMTTPKKSEEQDVFLYEIQRARKRTIMVA